MDCPNCGESENIAGMMIGFYVSLDNQGYPKGQWSDYESQSELSDMRSCGDCGHEWEVSEINEDDSREEI